jgi:hypothetical protein
MVIIAVDLGMIFRVLAVAIFLCSALPLGVAGQVFVEAELSSTSPLVQEETRYTLRAYRDSALQQGYFVAPEIPDVVIELLGESEPAWVMRDGRRWQLIERRYAIFPQRSGEILLPPPVFSGREVFARGPSLTLAVRHPTDTTAEWWLPAVWLKLEDHLSLPTPLAVDTPLERRLILSAQGLTGPQLPPLPLPNIEGWRVHRLNVETETRIEGEKIIGSRSERHMLVPLRGGEARLPEMVFPWWSVSENVSQRFVLPSRTIFVEGKVKTTPAPLPDAAPAKPVEPKESWPRSLGLIGLAALVWGWLIIRRFSDRGGNRRELAKLMLEFREASAKSDLVAARAALFAWSRLAYGEALTLPALAARLGETKATEALLLLDAISYGQSSEKWHIQRGEAIAAALRHGGRGKTPAKPPALPNL